jgi:succinate-semialdehyde dehydrogenase / glutarate-semialdehyde dehydrogenase
VRLFILTKEESDGMTDPANGNELGQVADMNVEDTKKAIDAASNALPAWSKTTAKVTFVRLLRLNST